MLDDIVIYDQNLKELCAPILELDYHKVPLQVCIAKTSAEFDNGCYESLIVGVHFRLTPRGTILLKSYPDSKTCRRLGLEDRYVIVVINDDNLP